jgi:hypothetical protein
MAEQLNPNQNELISEREVLEGMSSEEIVDLILAHGEKVSKYEGFMNLASDVLEGAYGITVEEVLQKRERETGNG